jgi:preprotein translocase subunit SecG
VTRTRRLLTTLTLFCLTLAVLAPVALAQGSGENGGGQGFYGETSDKVVTNTMFIVIAFFPTIILIFSLLQWRLDKRKHAKMDAAKRRAASSDWHGGW